MSQLNTTKAVGQRPNPLIPMPEGRGVTGIGNVNNVTEIVRNVRPH